jgi:MscS family membrane protein
LEARLASGRTVRAALLTAALLVSRALAGEEARQPAPVPESAPATQPTSAEAPNPLRSPRSMVAHFRATLHAAEEDPARLADALACLDLSRVDPEVARSEGAELARRLGAILDWLLAQRVFTPEVLPDDPIAETQVVGKDPLLLVIERRPNRNWQFSPSTVAEIPRMYAAVQAARDQTASEPAETQTAPASEAAGAVPPGLRSPRELMTHFLVALQEAQSDPDKYSEVLECLSFAAVPGQVAQDRAVEYAEDLGVILQRLLDEGIFTLEQLPDDPEAVYQTIGKDPLLIILTREEDGRWQFAARTVARIPEMHANLREGVELLKGGPAAGRGPAAAVGVPAEFRSPRATMETFLRAMAENDLRGAVRCLDLSELPAPERDARGRLLAGKLLLILRRHEVIVLQKIPDDPQYEGPYKHLVNRYGRIEIGRRVGEGRDERAGEWLFTPATVRSIDRLYDAWETRPLLPMYHGRPGIALVSLPGLWVRERLIPPSFKWTAFGLQYWQWIGIPLVLVIGGLAHAVARRAAPPIARRLLPARGAAAGYRLDEQRLRPYALLALVGTWWVGVELLDLGPRVIAVLWPVLRLTVVVVTSWAAYRTVDLVSEYSAARAANRETRLHDVLIPLVRKTLKVLVVAVGGTMVLTVLGVQVAPLLAGLGIGGLAFSFAAKDTLANFFGSINVVLDRPFQIGDWVRIRDFEGTVESVGLRSSRLRTADDSQLTIPNAELMNAVIDNMGRRRYRRLRVTLPVSYAATTEQLEAFCEGVRELIRRHPCTRKEQYEVAVRGLGSSAIEVLVNCFYEVRDWSTEVREQHRLLTDILRLARELGLEFAAPLFARAAGPVPAGLRDSPERAADFGRQLAGRLLEESRRTP